MTVNDLAPGLYLAKFDSNKLGGLIDHYGVLDIGNRSGFLIHPFAYTEPHIIHQTHPELRVDALSELGPIDVVSVERIPAEKEQETTDLIRKAQEDPQYRLFDNNCEHFARGVATGERTSTQVTGVFKVLGCLAVGCLVIWGLNQHRKII